MTTKGRLPSTEPATAYDYRRVLALVQVLALDDPAQQEAALLALCRGWGVEPAYLGSESDYPRWLAVMATVEKLAKHALEYSRKETHEDSNPV